MYYALIMAGGIGSRLWPLSRMMRPKQSLKLIGDNTMMEHSVDRIVALFGAEGIYVVTRSEHVPILAGQAPELPAANFIVEPEGRGTAPAIGLGAIHLHKQDPDAVMTVLTADHYITKTGYFRQVLAAAAKVAQEGHLVTLGITPSSPSTGYGYIQQGERIAEVDGMDVFRGVRFAEKPNQQTAIEMVESGEYSWNSGMFIWRVDRILEEFQRQMPEFYEQLMVVEASIDTPDYQTALDDIWPLVAKETIDYGIMERAEDVAVIPVDIGWSDVGSWGSIPPLLEANEQGNFVIGSHLGVDTSDSLIYEHASGRLIATIGLKDMIIIDTDDAVLVCPLDREQDVKAIVNLLESSGSDELL